MSQEVFYDPFQEVNEAINKRTFYRYLLKDGVNAVFVKPSWGLTKTVFRPFPAVRPEIVNLRNQGTNGSELVKTYSIEQLVFPYRWKNIKTNDWTFGPWIKPMFAAWNIGQPPTTFFFKPPNDGDVYSSPLGILYRAVWNAVNNKVDSISRYILDKGTRGNLVSKPCICLVMQGLLFESSGVSFNLMPNKKPYGYEPNPACFLLLKGPSINRSSALFSKRPRQPSTADKLLRLLNKYKQGFNKDSIPANTFCFEEYFEYGDPVHPKFGKFFYFAQSGTPISGVDNESFDIEATAQDVTYGYDVHLLPTYNGLPANIDDDKKLANLINKWIPFENALRILTEEEQVQVLSECLPEELILYAFKGAYDHWLPKRFLATQVSMGGLSYQPQTVQHQQQDESWSDPLISSIEVSGLKIDDTLSSD